jgi:hypothetical protein
MTFEEMLAEAARIAALIGGTVIREGVEPGDPIPIMYEQDGEDFVLELNVA